MEKIKALFFAANPVLTSRLSLDEEIRAITEKIHASRHHDSIDLVSALAVQPDDLLQKLNEYKPQIVHFSAHGNTEGELILLDKNGKPKPVSARAIHALLKILKDNIRVVVLNACYSQVQAREIKNVIDCVIGMKNSISDQAAIIFSASFYRAIGFGCSINDAFEQGKTALLLEGIPEVDIPELLVKEGADPARIFLLETCPPPPDKDIYRGKKERGAVLKGIKNILLSIGNPFGILSSVILVSPSVCRFFSSDYFIMNSLVKIELSSFWAIYVLLVFYLILASSGQLRKKCEDIKNEGLMVIIKVSVLQFGKEAINKPMRLLSRLILFLLFFPVIMESDYFFRNRLVNYHFYEVLAPLMAVLSLALIQVKPGKGFKLKISLGIKILSAAIISFLVFFPGSSENSGRRYYGWVDHKMFLNTVTGTKPPLIATARGLSHCIIQLLEQISQAQSIKSPISSGSDNKNSSGIENISQGIPEILPASTPITETEDITIEADAIGEEYDNDACHKAKEAAKQKYYSEHPHNTSELKEGEYEFGKCDFIKRLPNGQVRAKVTLKIHIKKEKK
jgi:hypothetical protein